MEKYEWSTWRFALAYTPLHEFLPPLHQALAASRLDPWERSALLQQAAADAMAAQRFDSSYLSQLSERIVANLPATRLTPLVRKPGRLVVTDQVSARRRAYRARQRGRWPCLPPSSTPSHVPHTRLTPPPHPTRPPKRACTSSRCTTSSGTRRC